MPLARDGDAWVGDVDDGTRYGLVATGDGQRFDPTKVLLDPWATEVWIPPGHDRQLARRRGASNSGCSPLAVARPRAAPRPSRRSSRAPVVYEAHVRGMTRQRGGAGAGTFAALVDELSRLARLGVSVLELMPVHQQDPQEGSYWGYMPLAFAAVDGRLAAGEDGAAELAALTAAAHDHDIEIWLDVVFNHTTEVDASGPTYHLRGLSDGAFYRLRADRSYIETTGCGNDIDVTSPDAQDLVMWSLDRLADLGVDGFRFDLAAVLTHDAGFVDRLDRWAAERGVVMVAEPWDAAGRYQLGPVVAGTSAGCSGTIATATTFAASCAARRGSCRRSSSACRGAPTCSTRRWRASTSSPATTGSRCTTSWPTTASTTRPTAGAAATARTTTGRGTVGGRATTACPPTSPRCAGASCATRGAWWRCPTACRWSAWATSSAAPRVATTTPTTRTTRRRGSTGNGRPRSPISSASPGCCSSCATATRCCRNRRGGART